MMVDAQTEREPLGVANENLIRLVTVPFCATQSRDGSHRCPDALTLAKITVVEVGYTSNNFSMCMYHVDALMFQLLLVE
jgi:hypothetical protein